MKKEQMADMARAIEAEAERAFNDMLGLTEQHGVCYFRFDLQNGLTIIDPRYNARLSGVIADA